MLCKLVATLKVGVHAWKAFKVEWARKKSPQECNVTWKGGRGGLEGVVRTYICMARAAAGLVDHLLHPS